MAKQKEFVIKRCFNTKLILISLSLVLIMTIGVLAISEVQRRNTIKTILATVNENKKTIKKIINFDTKQIKSYAHTVDYKEIKQAGAPGVREVKYSIKTFDDIVLKPVEQIEIVGARLPNALTKAKSAHIFKDSKGISHRETYYDLPMKVALNSCGGGSYSVREDGAKIDKDGYVLVAANYNNYPRCSLVETSMGTGRVYDTGGFAKYHPHGFDLATDWTNGDGR